MEFPEAIIWLPTTAPDPSGLVSSWRGAGAGLTVTPKELLRVLTPSLTESVTWAMPVWPEAGERVTVRLLPLPPRTMPLRGMRSVFEELLLRTKSSTDVSKSAMVKPMAGVVVLAVMVTFEIAEMDGAAGPPP